jgi:hypothetical protein
MVVCNFVGPSSSFVRPKFYLLNLPEFTIVPSVFSYVPRLSTMLIDES